jgi:hypothetical protein
MKQQAVIVAEPQCGDNPLCQCASLQQFVLGLEEVGISGLDGRRAAAFDDLCRVAINLHPHGGGVERRAHERHQDAQSEERANDAEDEPLALVEDAPVFQEVRQDAAVRFPHVAVAVAIPCR